MSELQKGLVKDWQVVMGVLNQFVWFVYAAEHALEPQILIATILESLQNGVSPADQLYEGACVPLNSENIVFLCHVILLNGAL